MRWAILRTDFQRRGGLWVLAQSVLMLAVVGGAPLTSGGFSRTGTVSGVALVLAGAYFGLAGVWALKGNRTAFPKPREGSVLIQSGIYAWVRHPLYTSVILVSLGWALVWQSMVALILSMAMAPFFFAKAKVEEQWWRGRYPEYVEYERRVCRFLPFIL